MLGRVAPDGATGAAGAGRLAGCRGVCAVSCVGPASVEEVLQGALLLAVGGLMSLGSFF